jgi:hypothetical protein
MSEVPLTDEWKEWVNWKVTRPELETLRGSILPVFNPVENTWLVYHPYSNVCMIVPANDYLTNWNSNRKFKTRYDT